MRKISPKFIADLKEEDGLLYPILERVRLDDTLQLAIRDGYINIYYRGGNIMRVENKESGYSTCFDCEYFVSEEEKPERPNINSQTDAQIWIDNFPRLKMEMDLYPRIKSKHPLEREFQQVIARVNNRSRVANGTDYFIADIELAEGSSRFDMTAIKWPSTSSQRQKGDQCKAAFIEVKYGDGALGGKSGINNHLHDFSNFVHNGYSDYLETMEKQFNTLCDLDLIDCEAAQNGRRIKLSPPSENKPEFIFLIANHKPASSILLREIEAIKPPVDFEIRFAVANFLGYGLYEKNMLSLKKFKILLEHGLPHIIAKSKLQLESGV